MGQTVKIKKIRKIIIGFFICGMIGLVAYIYYLQDKIPDTIFVSPNETESISLNIPFSGVISVYEQYSNEANSINVSVNLQEKLRIKANEIDTYKAKVMLFGIFKIKETDIVVREPEKVIPYGMAIGIHLETKGIYIVDIGNVVEHNGELSAPSRGYLTAGDCIYKINGNEINSKKEFVDCLNQSEGVVELVVKRNNEFLNIRINPVLDENNNKKLGIWIKDDYQGLGTLTYVDENGNFGALGHGICDDKSGNIIDIEEGYIFPAKIWSIVKSQKGKPGEVVGSIDYGCDCLGIISENRMDGIYGSVKQTAEADIYLPVGYKQKAHKGKAVIRSFVSGEIKDYEIEIEKITYSEHNKYKSITYRVTDEKLIAITNGIVQGMSGSPIIQDGYVIGAVTHVFVDKPTGGYGIFIEEMLE